MRIAVHSKGGSPTPTRGEMLGGSGGVGNTTATEHLTSTSRVGV
eukprot:gene26513-biopygen16718